MLTKFSELLAALWIQ